MKKDEPTIYYLCDGKKDCNKKYCYKHIGDRKEACKYTRDITHAENFHKVSPPGSETCFWEEDNVIMKQLPEYLAEIKGRTPSYSVWRGAQNNCRGGGGVGKSKDIMKYGNFSKENIGN